jgi:ubiquinone/menaquinone biosynthesis C-methylase UbiE
MRWPVDPSSPAFRASRSPDEIYQSQFVEGLFNDMAGTYGVVNVVSSFGFCVWWRRACVRGVQLHPGDRVLDLMSGMGEVWPSLRRALAGQHARVLGVDFSAAMCRGALRRVSRAAPLDVTVAQQDVFAIDIPAGSVDAIVCSFGLKTLNDGQQHDVALAVARWLRPGGTFSFLDISVPQSRGLRVPYMLYLRYFIPLLGRLLLGNPDCYRMLGEYTTRFGDASAFHRHCREAGLNADLRRHFFGCATSVRGSRPI